MGFVNEEYGVCWGSSNFYTVCKHIASLPLVDLHQTLDSYKSFNAMVNRISADIASIEELLKVDHDEMIRQQRCGTFKGYETIQQRFLRYCSFVPRSPQYLNDSLHRYQLKTAFLTEAFNIYGARACKIVDELLSLDAKEIIAFMKDWKLFNAQMKRINEQIDLQSQELLVKLKANI